MRLPKLIPLILFCLAAAPAFGQTILPKNFGDWTANSRAPYDLNGASVNSAAAAQEYGFAGGERATYSRVSAAGTGQPKAEPTLTATLYRMEDVSAAYGEYSYLRTPDMERADFTDHSFVKANEAVILAGNLVLDVSGVDPVKDAKDIRALVSAVAPHAEGGPLPSLPEHLPLANRIDRTDHYILGPQTLDQFFPGQLGSSLGFAYGTEVETAQFRAKGHDLTLLIADYPTPQIAKSQLDILQKKFNITESQENSSSPQTASSASGAGLPSKSPLTAVNSAPPSAQTTAAPTSSSPALFASRSSTLLAIVAGANSSDEANKLLSQVKSGTVLTWNEPTFQFKEPSIEMMIVGAIVGSGLICMFAVVAGLAFGGFRLGVKRLFPGKVFDRNNQVDFLQLALTGKPIKAEDFYGFESFSIKGDKLDKNLPDRTALRIFK